jgi:hypothetical protein
MVGAEKVPPGEAAGPRAVYEARRGGEKPREPAHERSNPARQNRSRVQKWPEVDEQLTRRRRSNSLCCISLGADGLVTRDGKTKNRGPGFDRVRGSFEPAYHRGNALSLEQHGAEFVIGFWGPYISLRSALYAD